MIHIDPRTVVLLAGVMSGFMAVILYALKRSYPPAIKGLGEWAVALGLVAVGGWQCAGLRSGAVAQFCFRDHSAAPVS